MNGTAYATHTTIASIDTSGETSISFPNVETSAMTPNTKSTTKSQNAARRGCLSDSPCPHAGSLSTYNGVVIG